MSLNIVDSLLDKLSFVSKDRNIPLGNKFTGSQNFLGTNSYGLSQSIPSEFTRAFMDPEYLTQAHNRMNRSSSLDSKMNYFHCFEPSSDRLVSRVSKLLSPVFTPQDCFRILPLDLLQDQEFYNRGVNIFCEEIEQHIDMLSKMLIPNIKSCENTSQVPTFSAGNLSDQEKEPISVSKSELSAPNRSPGIDIPSHQNKTSTLNQPKSSTEIPSNHLKVLNSHFKSDKNTCQTNIPSVTSPLEIMMQDNAHPLATEVVQENKKPSRNNNQTMNKELANRKNKELQKRSKKRRRRQKKINLVLDKECVTKAEKTPKSENKIQLSQASPKNESSDILCDITINDSAGSVQILLPNASSFVISIEGAEDDSDWDSSSDCEWLTDCSEFELSGIFISNLSTPLTSSFSGECISRLSVPSSHAEEVEMRHLGAALRRVNKDWIESTKGLDTKPKVATKVSFAPDDELVEVLHVDIYERKGEWETYATERMRFKRRIGEIEKIISPCLSKEHREKIFLRFHDSNL